VYEKAIEVLSRIAHPNEFLIASFLKVCAQMTDENSLNLAKRFLSQMDPVYQTNEYILCTASHLFTKYGDLSTAEYFLSKMSKSLIKCGGLMKIHNINKEPEKTFALYK
jgi:hypothetical protein